MTSPGGFGRPTAIEAFEEAGDPRCGPVPTGLPDGDNPTARAWTVTTLASLEIDDAVEPLRRAHRARSEAPTGIDRIDLHPER